MSRLWTTTSRRAAAADAEAARRAAAELGGEFVPRDELGPLGERAAQGAVLVFGGEALPVLHTRAGPLRFHPGMAHQRIGRLAAGGRDPLVEAGRLRPGDVVLDATLGLGADALVAAYAVGPEGTVIGLEREPLLAWLVADGLARYAGSRAALREAAGRIRVLTADHLTYLSAQPERSVDVVCFDPMFRDPVPSSSGLAPARPLVHHEPLRPEALAAARRVARRCVVVKERAHSPLFAAWGAEGRLGGKGSRIAYGVWGAQG